LLPPLTIHPLRKQHRRQAGDVRSEIGSGLLQLGVQPGDMVGLYSTNCKGELR